MAFPADGAAPGAGGPRLPIPADGKATSRAASGGGGGGATGGRGELPVVPAVARAALDLQLQGWAVIEDVIPPAECQTYIDGVWGWLERLGTGAPPQPLASPVLSLGSKFGVRSACPGASRDASIRMIKHAVEMHRCAKPEKTEPHRHDRRP